MYQAPDATTRASVLSNGLILRTLGVVEGVHECLREIMPIFHVVLPSVNGKAPTSVRGGQAAVHEDRAQTCSAAASSAADGKGRPTIRRSA
jgi:5'(3')-deoxyribonucleotidase